MSTTIIMFAIIGIATYGLRSSLVVAQGDGNGANAWLEQRMAFVGPAALAGLTTGYLFVDHGSVSLAAPAEVLAVAAGITMALRTKNPGWALAVGLPVFWLLSAIGFGPSALA